MFKRFRKAAALGLFAATVVTAGVWAAGNWSTLPQVAMSSFCASTVSGVTLPTAQGPYGIVPGSTQGTGSSICGQTVPAGPTALTGSEIIPADTQIANSAPPQTVTIPITLLDSGSYSYLAVPGSSTYLATIPNNINTFILDPTATVSIMTLTMPSSPLNGQQLHITSTHTITAFVLVGAAGQTISNNPTILTVSTTGSFGYTFMWDTPNTTWYRTQ